MIKHKIIISLLMSLLVISCSKGEQKTTAKLKLNLSGITNLAGVNVGAGGALLFGKSASGEQFGRVVAANEQDMDLPNGDWSFYAVMWENSTAGGNFKDTVYCGKSAQKLTGAPLSISMNLSNSTCTDADFSNGSHYVESKNKFPNLFIEECDDLSKSNSFTCLRDNQGSALSYRMAFKNYNKTAAGVLNYTGEVMYSACKNVTSMKQGTGLNFPTSRQAMPFTISVEMFLGSPDCGVSNAETKGMFTHTFLNGIASESSAINKMAVSPATTCSYGPANEASCLNYFGTWSGSVCSLPDATVALFLPVAECGGASSVFISKSLKQMVSIPKDYLCRDMSANVNLTGADVFPGGNGTTYRPYKICNEWQFNQIGEKFSTIDQSKNYKLMNDLDMNKLTFGAYPKPYCADKTGVDKYFNMNPLDRMDCESSTATGTPYSGVFNGNGKIIKNGRITTKDMAYLGFVRTLTGTIKNLIFQNLEVRGSTYVGGIAGGISGSATIENIRINRLEIEGVTTVGGITGATTINSSVKNVKIDHGKIRASSMGGIVGYNEGTINKAVFRGFIVPYNTTGDYAGGIASYNSGEVSEVASEGLISSATNHIAGIVAKNTNIVKNCYSTMAIVPLYSVQSLPLKASGIVAYNYGGSSQVNNCYSDSTVSYTGVATLSYSGTVTSNEGSVAVASVFTNANNSPGSATGASYDAMRAASPPSGITMTTPTLWTFTSGSLPRLAWEVPDRECLKAGNLSSVTAQKSSGKGATAANPILICNITQLSEAAYGAATDFYRMGDDINLSKWTLSTNLLPGFSGTLDGNDRGLSGLKYVIADDSSGAVFENHGIIRNNSGTIKNLFLIGNEYNSVDPDYTKIGILAGINSGNISEIQTYGSYVRGRNVIGGLVGFNTSTGVISSIRSDRSNIIGEFQVGGIAGVNEGTIFKVSTNSNISNGPYTAYAQIGGIAGTNNKVIDQAMASGSFNFPSITTAPTHSLGGLVGYNSNPGIISNSFTDKYTSMYIGGAEGVGGAVGVMDGSSAQLKKSFSLTKMNFTQSEYDLTSLLDQTNDANDDRVIGPLVGTVLSSAIVANSFYVKNALVIGMGSGSVSTCGPPIVFSSGPALTVNGVFSTMDLIAPMDYSFIGANSFTPMDVFSCQTSQAINFFTAYGNYSEHGQVATAANLKQISMFTAAGFSIADSDSQAALNYHLALMNGTPIPAATPIWELDSEDGYPKLLQLDRH